MRLAAEATSFEPLLIAWVQILGFQPSELWRLDLTPAARTTLRAIARDQSWARYDLLGAIWETEGTVTDEVGRLAKAAMITPVFELIVWPYSQVVDAIGPALRSGERE